MRGVSFTVQGGDEQAATDAVWDAVTGLPEPPTSCVVNAVPNGYASDIIVSAPDPESLAEPIRKAFRSRNIPFE